MTEQEKLDRLIAEKRHKQIVDGQAALSDSINKFTEAISESNKATIGAINSNGKQIGAFAEAITKIPAPVVNSPEVNIETNQEKVITSLEQLGEAILAGQQEVARLLLEASKPKKWNFTVHTEFDKIKNVIAEQIK